MDFTEAKGKNFENDRELMKKRETIILWSFSAQIEITLLLNNIFIFMNICTYFFDFRLGFKLSDPKI